MTVTFPRRDDVNRMTGGNRRLTEAFMNLFEAVRDANTGLTDGEVADIFNVSIVQSVIGGSEEQQPPPVAPPVVQVDPVPIVALPVRPLEDLPGMPDAAPSEGDAIVYSGGGWSYQTGATGTFTASGGEVVTVTAGQITSIV